MAIEAGLTNRRVSLRGFTYSLNTRWHKRALAVFLVIVLAHWSRSSSYP